MIRTVLVVAALLTPFAASAGEISGASRVIDGDTVVVGKTHVRLKGVDAAEMNTELGRAARKVMVEIVGGGTLRCELTGEKTYKREVGYCFTAGGVDIGQAIIEKGAALACPRYSMRYVEFEQNAALEVQKRARYCGAYTHPETKESTQPPPPSYAATFPSVTTTPQSTPPAVSTPPAPYYDTKPETWIFVFVVLLIMFKLFPRFTFILVALFITLCGGRSRGYRGTWGGRW